MSNLIFLPVATCPHMWRHSSPLRCTTSRGGCLSLSVTRERCSLWIQRSVCNGLRSSLNSILSFKREVECMSWLLRMSLLDQYTLISVCVFLRLFLSIFPSCCFLSLDFLCSIFIPSFCRCSFYLFFDFLFALFYLYISFFLSFLSF
jgi:hypothetical protein